LYTESYATEYENDRSAAIKPFVEAAFRARELGLGLNAGHDLSLENLNYFIKIFHGLMKHLLAML